MEKRTIFKLITTIAVFVSMGGCVKPKEQTKQAQTVVSSSTKEDKEAIKQKQIAYLKEHEQEIVDFVKSQNPKIESVQIDWDETQMSDGGLTTPEYYMNIFGRINHIENSGWGVDFPINDDQSINLREMFMLHEPTIGGKPIS
ncbi:hypothetical protein PNU95_03070 [Streptococcus parasanguinis]|uniref:Lipoprotein n=1 Tax=Streptococcus gingivalis TaxID=3111861 RepID=A0ABU6B649_9STRE|nr:MULTISPECIES: hypothetical protein [Streptococcus]MBK5058237.1 hypothetical protein [Streptococcus parasanguinis]MCP9034933.1 hypothetical protein [Streptococcus sp. CF8_Ac1-9]MCP9043576.1 hypothetical protein [Streptococcus sp. CF8_Ac1-11]MDB8627324.1 hypothetical protein [Streptococcus parasanguinis]MDU7552810.1 hypothetical protein [Streptococcus parasanguinis]